MQFDTKNQKLLMVAALFTATPAFAVDLVGVHDLAVEHDPQLQAAAFRKEAVGENERQAWSNLLPTLSGSASLNRGDNEISVSGTVVSESDIDNESYGLDLRQSLYAQSNYENLDIARGQVSQAEAVYNLAYQDFLVRVAGGYFSVLTAQDGVIFAEAEEKALLQKVQSEEVLVEKQENLN